MKKLLFIIFVLGISQGIFAQDGLKRANLYFERTFYSDAIPLYEQLLERHKSPELIKNLADCYYSTFDMEAAARWYTYLASNYGSRMDESYYFKLNQSLKAIGDYDRANQVLLDFYAQHYGADKVDQLKTEITYLENVRAIGERFTISNLDINTPTSEFGAVKVDSMLVYSATRKHTGKTFRWNNQKYLDIYVHPFDGLNMGDSLSTDLSKTINTKRKHEGTFAITKDRKTLYFTRNGRKGTESEKIKNLKIYSAERVDGSWTHIRELPFNGDGFSTEHPALNADGTQLYFASDRDGGFGSFDIYSVAIHNDGTYGNPINLGEDINTDKKEQFPFLDEAGNLYFSSNGHPGYGLLDIFLAKRGDGIFEKPDNLGLPVNSGYDDFSLSLEGSGKTGYFASNRPGGKGSDDIYSFTETKPLVIESCRQYIAGTLTDKNTKLPLAHADIRLLDAQGNIVESLITDQNAFFEFMTECSTEYRIEAEKKGFEDNFKIIRTDKERNAVNNGSLTLFSVQERERQNALILREKQEEAEKAAKAEAERKAREEKMAEQERIQKEKELEEKAAIARKKADMERQQDIEETIAREESIVKENDRIIIKTPEIHFDYSLWYLRRESRERLGKVIEIMKAYPGIVLEIGTHTDIRGNAEYNRDLSQKRADVAKDFLVKSGIAEHRIIAKGYGETSPIVICEPEDSCSEEDHEWNRRCELVIIKWE